MARTRNRRQNLRSSSAIKQEKSLPKKTKQEVKKRLGKMGGVISKNNDESGTTKDTNRRSSARSPTPSKKPSSPEPLQSNKEESSPSRPRRSRSARIAKLEWDEDEANRLRQKKGANGDEDGATAGESSRTSSDKPKFTGTLKSHRRSSRSTSGRNSKYQTKDDDDGKTDLQPKDAGLEEEEQDEDATTTTTRSRRSLRQSNQTRTSPVETSRRASSPAKRVTNESSGKAKTKNGSRSTTYPKEAKKEDERSTRSKRVKSERGGEEKTDESEPKKQSLRSSRRNGSKDESPPTPQRRSRSSARSSTKRKTFSDAINCENDGNNKKDESTIATPNKLSPPTRKKKKGKHNNEENDHSNEGIAMGQPVAEEEVATAEDTCEASSKPLECWQSQINKAAQKDPHLAALELMQHAVAEEAINVQEDDSDSKSRIRNVEVMAHHFLLTLGQHLPSSYIEVRSCRQPTTTKPSQSNDDPVITSQIAASAKRQWFQLCQQNPQTTGKELCQWMIEETESKLAVEADGESAKNKKSSHLQPKKKILENLETMAYDLLLELEQNLGDSWSFFMKFRKPNPQKHSPTPVPRSADSTPNHRNKRYKKTSLEQTANFSPQMNINSWMNHFLQASKRDPRSTAVDLVEIAVNQTMRLANIESRKDSLRHLESFAKSMLRELEQANLQAHPNATIVPTTGTTVDEATRPSHLNALDTLKNCAVEKLCPRTGTILNRYPSGLAAQAAISSCSQTHFFYYALVGRNKGTPAHIYKRYFWRLEGSNHLPGGCACSLESSATDTTCTLDAPLLAMAPTTTTRLNKDGSTSLKRDPYRDMPVEKMDRVTGVVLERFETAEQAHQSVSDSGPGQFGNFKKVLQGKFGSQGRVYKGYFWRLEGSHHFPGSSSPKRQPSTSKRKQPTNESTKNIVQPPSMSSAYRDLIRYMPVERLSLATGEVVERFDTAEQAYRSISDSKVFCNFKKVLEGRQHGVTNQHVFKGSFWRIEGSSFLPAHLSDRDSNGKPPNHVGTGLTEAQMELLATTARHQRAQKHHYPYTANPYLASMEKEWNGTKFNPSGIGNFDSNAAAVTGTPDPTGAGMMWPHAGSLPNTMIGMVTMPPVDTPTKPSIETESVKTGLSEITTADKPTDAIQTTKEVNPGQPSALSDSTNPLTPTAMLRQQHDAFMAAATSTMTSTTNEIADNTTTATSLASAEPEMQIEEV